MQTLISLHSAEYSSTPFNIMKAVQLGSLLVKTLFEPKTLRFSILVNCMKLNGNQDGHPKTFIYIIDLMIP